MALKTSYENLKAGDFVMLNSSGIYNGQYLDAGTKIVIDGFTPKPKNFAKNWLDKNRKGFIRKFIISGKTVVGNMPLTTELCNIVK